MYSKALNNYAFTGFIKHFNDDTNEEISDIAVKLGKASWKKGRFDGLVAVTLKHRLDDFKITIFFLAEEGEWWISDTFIAKVNNPEKLVARRIEKKIKKEDVGKFIVCTRIDTEFSVMILPVPPPGFLRVEKIKEEFVDKWIHVTLHLPEDVLFKFKEPTMRITIEDKKV